MEKCKDCGAELVSGKCPDCEARNQVVNMVNGLQVSMTAQLEDQAKQLKAIKDQNDEVTKQNDELAKKVNRITFVKENVEDDPMAGYRNHTEYLLDVMAAGKKGAAPPERLIKAHTILKKQRFNAVGSDEHTMEDNSTGGFLIPGMTMPGIKTTDAQELMLDTGKMTNRIPIPMGGVKINARVDKNHSTSYTGGFRMYREKEASQITSSRGTFEQIELDPHPLYGIAYASEKLLSAAPATFIALINNSFGDEEIGKLNYERLWGTGVGEYEGITSASCKIEVAKESGQTNDTIVGLNILKMRARAWRYGQCIWMANQDTLTQLFQAHIALTNTDIMKLYNPDTNTILGRPVYFDENCATLGDAGDIMLVNWNEYYEGTVGSTRKDQSIHLRFDYAETAFRTLAHNAGAPAWKTALTPKKSSDTLSPIVTLAAR